MNNYILSVDSDDKEIITFSVKNSYSFNPKNRTTKAINAKQITIYDKDTIADILSKKYSIKLKRLLKVINSILASEDASDDDYMACLDEIVKLRNLLIYKYQAYLRKEDYARFVDELVFTDNYFKSGYLEKSSGRKSK